MHTFLLVVLFGLAGGVAVGLHGPLSSLMSQRIGTMESVFIIHLGGAVMALLPLVVAGGGNLGHWRSVPWYALVAGAFGLVVIGAISYAIPRVGVATTIILIVAGQLTVGALLDNFGLLGTAVRPFDVWRIAGILVLSVGVWLMVR